MRKIRLSATCPRCGETDLAKPCRGSPEHGSKPLHYRHSGRLPAPQVTLGPSLKPPGQVQDNPAAPPRFPVPPCVECWSLDTIEHDGDGGPPARFGNMVTCDSCGAEGQAAQWLHKWGGAQAVRILRAEAEAKGVTSLTAGP